MSLVYEITPDGHYRLLRDYSHKVPFLCSVDTDEFYFNGLNGQLIIKKGFKWDGPSGPAVDTVNVLRASLVHDALYSLIASGKLKSPIYRELSDKLFYDIAREDGVGWFRAKYFYWAVRVFGRLHI